MGKQIFQMGKQKFTRSVLHQLDQKIIYTHYDFKHLTEKYFEIGMKLDDFLIQLVKYCRLTKTLGVLLLVSFIMFVTAVSASANAHDRDASASETNGYGSRDSKIGSLSGSQYGYKEGYNAGLEDCLKHGREGVLTKITDPEINDKWTGKHKRSYREGFNKGYFNGYNDARFKCLKK